MNDGDIPLIVSCSEQIDGIIAGHQQEMQQVLENNRRLRTAIAQQKSMLENKDREINELTQIKNEQAEIIRRLEAENAQLRKRPLNNFTDCNIGELIENKLSYGNSNIQSLSYPGTGA